MRKLNLILFVLALIIGSCKNTSKQMDHNILGSWYFCDLNGDYNEVHFASDFFVHSIYFNPDGWKYYYVMKGDSLLFYNNEEIIETKISFKDFDHISQTILDNNTNTLANYELTRINYDVKLPTPYETDSISLKNRAIFLRLLFERRMKQNGCHTKLTDKKDLKFDSAFVDPF